MRNSGGDTDPFSCILPGLSAEILPVAMDRQFTSGETEDAIKALNAARFALEVALERCEKVARPDIEDTIQEIEGLFNKLKSRGVSSKDRQ